MFGSQLQLPQRQDRAPEPGAPLRLPSPGPRNPPQHSQAHRDFASW